MLKKNFRIIAGITLFFLCLNVFCLSSFCAYADTLNLNTTSSCQSFSNDDGNCSDNNVGADADNCYLCNGHCCLSQLTFINNTFAFSVLDVPQQFNPEASPSVQSVVLQSIPKPPCSYLLI